VHVNEKRRREGEKARELSGLGRACAIGKNLIRGAKRRGKSTLRALRRRAFQEFKRPSNSNALPRSPFAVPFAVRSTAQILPCKGGPGSGLKIWLSRERLACVKVRCEAAQKSFC
jgi:hypothetical protein